jgi:F-type H+-transporting ATPase subunit delta
MPTNRMLDKQAAAAYVSCLLEAAQGANRVFEDLEDLRAARRAVSGSSQMREFLQNRSIPAKNKKAFLRDALKGMSPEVISTVAVMAERDEIRLLGRVTENYESAAEAATKSVVVDVTTAVPLDDHLREVIKAKLKADLGSDVRLNESVDRSILGGIIMSAHGKLMDASVKTQLVHARSVLSKVPTGGDE